VAVDVRERALGAWCSSGALHPAAACGRGPGILRARRFVALGGWGWPAQRPRGPLSITAGLSPKCWSALWTCRGSGGLPRPAARTPRALPRPTGPVAPFPGRQLASWSESGADPVLDQRLQRLSTLGRDSRARPLQGQHTANFLGCGTWSATAWPASRWTLDHLEHGIHCARTTTKTRNPFGRPVCAGCGCRPCRREPFSVAKQLDLPAPTTGDLWLRRTPRPADRSCAPTLGRSRRFEWFAEDWTAPTKLDKVFGTAPKQSAAQISSPTQPRPTALPQRATLPHSPTRLRLGLNSQRKQHGL